MDSENNPDHPVENAEGASAADNTQAATAAPADTSGAADAAPSGGETAEEKRARQMAEIKAKAAARMAAKGGATPKPETSTAQTETAAAAPPSSSATPAPPDAPSGETPEEKRARIMAEAKAKAAAKMAAAKGNAAASESPSATPAPAGTVAPTAAKVPSTPPQEVPSGTPPAARVAPGAAKTSTTPTASVAKGIPQPVAAKQHPTVVDTIPDPPINKMRRRIVWASIIGFMATSLLMFFRFFLPRTIFEPSSIFRVGFPGDYGIGVDTKYQQLYRIWVVKTSDRLFVINAVCTHLGCTPDWKASENKFKCPCHGSGYDSEGINFEGPAPRPMDRAHVELDAEGQIVVNKGILYDWPKGGENKFDKETAFIPL
ncbi:MAG: Rieske 2Fe-2S domain-containing protein [Acidobacteria bacterium]|nr:Rieske 2Fe-2S domain-containing protein [Acidobacteriota bacterium]